jgi:hypothetical protein
MSNITKKNKQQQKNKPPASAVQVRVNDRPRDIKEWQSMIVAPSSNFPVRTPSLSPYTGAVRTFVRTFSLQSKGVNDPFSIIFQPNAKNSLAISAASAHVLDPAGWTLSDGSGIQIDEFAPGSNGFASLYGSLDILDNSSVNVGEYYDSVDPSGVHIYELAGDPTTTIQAHYSGSGATFSCYAKVVGVWTWVATSSILSTVASVLIGPIAGGFTALYFTVSNATKANGNGLSLLPIAGTDPILQLSSSYDLFSTDAVQLGRVSTFRVTAASVLASFSGNELENGGTIAAARTRKGYVYDETDPYTALTKLQDHSYRGVLKLGAYVWWLPYDLEEMDPRPPHHSQNGTELHLAGHFDDANGSLEVTLCMTVEFYSPLQIFEHQPGPPLDDNFVRAYHALDVAEAATCNPKHGSILKKSISKVGKAAKGTSKFLLDNPELLALLMGI